MNQPTEAEALAAMCIWEACLGEQQLYAWMIFPEGACEGRDNALRLAKFAELAYVCAAEKGFDAPYDWQFIPAFLALAQIMLKSPNHMTHKLAETFGESIYVNYERERKNETT